MYYFQNLRKRMMPNLRIRGVWRLEEQWWRSERDFHNRSILRGILSPLRLTQDLKWYTPIATEQWSWWQDWPRWHERREEHNKHHCKIFYFEGSEFALMRNSQGLCICCLERSTRTDVDRCHKLSSAAPVHASQTSNICWRIYICGIPISHGNVLLMGHQLTSDQPWKQSSEARRGEFECPIVKATSRWCSRAKLSHGHGDKNQEHTTCEPLILISIVQEGWTIGSYTPDHADGTAIRDWVQEHSAVDGWKRTIRYLLRQGLTQLTAQHQL